MKRKAYLCSAGILMAFLVAGCGKENEEALSPKNPVTITVWNYYNGSQLEEFNNLVEEFNSSVGAEKGIVVTGYSQGGVEDLEKNIMDALKGKAGASKVPNLFSAYADTAYSIAQMDKVVSLDEYFTKEELAEYVDSYIEEGRFKKESGLNIFPIAKSTEIFLLNWTDWQKFSEATNADESQLATYEGITKTAEDYYNWTDSLTPDIKNDGKAFFGRDARANYFISGLRQHGKEVFEVTDDGEAVLNFDEDIVRKLWDNYYVPYVKGYFSSVGRFRSDDVKIGNIISFIGSSAGATFFPSEVSLNETETYPIESKIYECPIFEGQEKVAIQQGAGMVVLKASKKEELASVEFLKWFTEDEQNIKFAIASGYMPVKKSANNVEKIKKETNDPNVETIVKAGVDMVNTSTMYTTKAFEHGTDARKILEYSLSDKAEADRKIVEERLAGGAGPEEAEAEFLSDQNFQDWYQTTKTSLEELIK